MVRRINDYLHVIKIRLVGSPLRDLNCYVIRTDDRNLLIDTGFNQPECLVDLRAGIAELGLDMNRTDILATHYHADHCGLVDKIATPQSVVYMGEIDKSLLELHRSTNRYWSVSRALFLQEGYPVDMLEKSMHNNPAKALVAEKPVALTPLKDGQELTVGGIRLRCIHTPGHTPGHMCLYNEQDKFMVLGDHVLFDITPNITTWPTLRNSLKSYLESLRMIREYDVALPLPGHRECDSTMTERIDGLLRHHRRRLDEMLQRIREKPGIDAYRVAGGISWSIRAKSWEDFPPPQKWFAMGETLSHLYYLEEEGTIRRELKDDLAGYTIL